MTEKLQHIGTVELVSLPEAQIQNVPAKVDTGADSSAIWATAVENKSKKLSFRLFAAGSAYHSDERVETTDFKTIRIKNSFGHIEVRYKVRLEVAVGGHRVTEWFTLADRSRNTYPILLGKNFLKHRFVVDVSRQYLVSHGVAENHVLVLDRSPKLTGEFFKTVGKANKAPLEYGCSSYASLIYYLNGRETSVVNVRDNTDIARYAFTYFKSHAGNTELAAAAAEYLQFKSRPFTDRELAHYISASKLTEYTRLTCFGLPIPLTICAKTPLLKKRFNELELKLGLPFVLKEIFSEAGENNYLVTNKREFDKVLAAASKSQIYLAQQYIENDALYRVYVAGRQEPLVLKRKTPASSGEALRTHLNSFRTTAQVRHAQLPPNVTLLAKRAARSLGRQVAGVDIVEDKHTKKWYILEVNSSPQLRSGAFTDEKAALLAGFFDEELQQ